MTDNLWSTNTPDRFWRCLTDFSDFQWDAAIEKACSVLQLPSMGRDIDGILKNVLGEYQFGPSHWQLSTTKRLYYLLKPILPRCFTRSLRQFYGDYTQKHFPLSWPIEERYVRFLWDIMKNLLQTAGKNETEFIHFWPRGYRFAFVLTHDIETARGQANVNKIVELEESLGFRSSFNFIPERYKIDEHLIRSLRERSFEIGIHGLKHDGKLFSSREVFNKRATKINKYLASFGAVGFRAPLTHRQPAWMQSLNIEYDTSFFDTDPYEPIPGGTMSIWPFEIGHFIELPYTLAQDYTLMNFKKEKTPRIWLEKVDFIEKYHGMVLLNTHPDYLLNPKNRQIYETFLWLMKIRGNTWHALPRDVAAWWRKRANANMIGELPDAIGAKIRLEGQEVVIDVNSEQPRGI